MFKCSFSEDDKRYLKLALDLAALVKGTTSPNPSVGAVIVNRNVIVGMGATQTPGKDHAEIVALKKAGEKARGATLYVNMEPCCHFGRTAPCSDAIINACIKKVVCSMQDPNPIVNGKGFAKLKTNGICVLNGLFRKEAYFLNREYIKFIKTGRPFVTLKLAMTLDGRIADSMGNSKWITGIEMRKKIHRMRSQHDAVMVGCGTVLKDNPRLTVRYVKGNFPARVIIDPELKIGKDFFLARTAKKIRTIIIHSRKNIGHRVWEGAEYLHVKGKNSMSVPGILKSLAACGITSVLVEGGGRLASSFVRENAVDRYCFCYGALILGEGINGIEQSGVKLLKKAIKLCDINVENCGNDILITGYPLKKA
ncbi:MAG: bifunctional diaminohydroxyphosphoribosylaminopyrimidine deaminase/5-amino-6-(5-phosphoribosylamino)uracil reductase RibD, partial [Elusimicrobiota bacterium]